MDLNLSGQTSLIGKGPRALLAPPRPFACVCSNVAPQKGTLERPSDIASTCEAFHLCVFECGWPRRYSNQKLWDNVDICKVYHLYMLPYEPH